MTKLKRIKEIFFEELKSPEGLNFPEILESVKRYKIEYVEPKLLGIIEYKQKEADELIILLYNDKGLLKLDNKLKLGLICSQIIKIVGSHG